jgi:uncharacterized protein YkwD
MRRFFLLAILALGLVAPDAPAESRPAGSEAIGADVVSEMNLARQNPAAYATILEKLRGSFQGDIFTLPGGTKYRTREGVGAIDEAIRFLRHSRPGVPLAWSSGISLAAAAHVADQATGSLGHAGSDQSSPAERMNRFGAWSGYWGENISYGKANARDIVIALIIDDGQRGRKHRKNIFNPVFHFAGSAFGPHARYRSVCSIDFAAGYTEATSAPRRLFARN